MAMSGTKHRVAITGMGCVTALGNNTGEFWESLSEGRSGIALLRQEIPEKPLPRVAAEASDFDPKQHFDDKHLLVLDRFSQFALAAAREAVSKAGLDFDDQLKAQSAVILGTGTGGKSTDDGEFRKFYREGRVRSNPMTILRVMASAATSHVGAEFGITGPSFSVTSACSSAGHAIGQAFMMIRQGMVPVALTGGSEACLTPGTILAWEGMRVMSPDTCRPFSKDRQGLVLGEGGGVLVLESMEHARQRDVPIFAELVSVGMSADAGHITRPSEEGASSALTKALNDGGLSPDAIQYVNAHGTGTVVNDVTETRVLHRSFGAHARKLAISSTKSMHGHTLGASGAIELIATTLALHHSVVPPTANFTSVDPQCDLDYTPNEARPMNIDAAVSNSFAFGGLNAVLAIRKCS